MQATPTAGADVLAPEMALSHLLNFSRAIAALLVLLFHIRTTLVVPYDELDVHNWLAKVTYAISTFGHDAVIIFFVLSGYLVGGAALRIDFTSSRDLRLYGIDRGIRIGPVLIAAALFSAVLQYTAPLPGCSDTPVTLMGNALALQNFLVRPLCNNLPLWSISNEVVYYFAFPVMLAVRSRAFSIWLGLSLICVTLVGVLSLGLAPLDETNIVLDCPFWLIGAALWFLPDISPRWRWLALLFVAAALLFGRLEIGRTHFWFRDLFLAATFSFLLATFRNQPMPRSGVRAAVAGHVADCSRWFADFSFSLYVTHYPLIKLYAYVVLTLDRQEARYTAITPGILLEFMGLGAICILLAFGFGVLLERPRRLFKRTIARQLRIS
ncbi:MAG: acyltransferase [Bradyrhizobium sp.]|nr:acyltransferase [Bradyrhizobium sp.]